MAWSIVLTDRSGGLLDEVTNGKNREVSFGLNRPNTAKFDLRNTDPIIPQMMTAKPFVKMYNGAKLMFHGIIIGANRVATADTKTTSFALADPSWYWQRLFLMNYNGGSTTFPYSSTLCQGSPRDTGDWFMGLLNASHGTGGAYVRHGAPPYSTGNPYMPNNSGTSLAATYCYSDDDLLKSMSAWMGQLSGGGGSFDWEIAPTDYLTGGYTLGTIGDLHIAPTIGTSRTARFEYGPNTLGNIATVGDSIDVSTMANFARDHNIDAPVLDVWGLDLTSIGTYGLMNDTFSSGMWDSDLRKDLVDEHVRVRSKPQRIVTFQPKAYATGNPGNVPVFGTDFGIGDFVGASAGDDNGTWFDGTLRVYGWVAKPDDLGVEGGEITLVDETGATV